MADGIAIIPNQSGFESRGSLITTTGATQSTGAVFQTQTDCAYAIEAKILAVETVDHDEQAFYWLLGTFRNDGGTVTQQGSTASVIAAIETTGGWAAVFDVDGTTIRARVTGAASTSVRWLTDISVKKLT